VLEEIDAEERAIIEAREAKSRSLVRAKARYSLSSEDPFEYAGIVATQRRSTSVGSPATDRQIELLRKWGCPRPESLSRHEAKRVIDAIAARPSVKQAYLLRKWGLEPSLFTRKTASQVISERMARSGASA
jgi:hypothetical protein